MRRAREASHAKPTAGSQARSLSVVSHARSASAERDGAGVNRQATTVQGGAAARGLGPPSWRAFSPQARGELPLAAPFRRARRQEGGPLRPAKPQRRRTVLPPATNTGDMRSPVIVAGAGRPELIGAGRSAPCGGERVSRSASDGDNAYAAAFFANGGFNEAAVRRRKRPPAAGEADASALRRRGRKGGDSRAPPCGGKIPDVRHGRHRPTCPPPRRRRRRAPAR